MPFVMNYTDPSGVNYPASFWEIGTNSQNHPGRTMSVMFNGYKSVDDFNAGMQPIGQQTFLINGPAYDTWIRPHFEFVYLPDTIVKSFQRWIEAAVKALSAFFVGAEPPDGVSSASPVILVAGQGFADELDTRVNVTFSGAVGNPTPGVAIKINGSPVTITGANQALGNIQQIQYDIATAIQIADLVTWEYDWSVGSIGDQELRPLRSFSALPVVNQAGESWQFNSAENSGQFALIF